MYRVSPRASAPVVGDARALVVHDARVIETESDLASLARDMASSAELGLDGEGDGFHRYRGRLCTLQVAIGEATFVVDTLAVPTLAPLAAVLGDERPTKVLHDCVFDARMLAAAGIELRGVFDTAIAARFLGEVSTGLGALLARHLGVTVAKEHQRADWGARPLSEDELAYLADDVRHLVALADVLRALAEQAGILDEVRAVTLHALDTGKSAPDEPPPWTRIKGAGELRSPSQLAVLRELALAREALAAEADVPPFRILPNALLLTIAKRPPRSPQEARQIAALARHRRLVPALLAAVERGIAARAVPDDEMRVFRPPPLPPAERELRRRRESALSAFRKAEAERRGVDPQVVLPGHALRDLAARGARDHAELSAISGLGGVRGPRYGAALLELLASATVTASP